MKHIYLKKLHIQNFKGSVDRTIEFGERTRIDGANATGKTTIFDAFTWNLFNKDSLGSSKFDIRPLDSDGKPIDNIEISVEATILVDGEEYVLKKVQKQNWVKQRGTGNIEFKGNVNEFEINGYPKSEKEFKAFIASMIDEKIFNLITNPNAFNALPWKEQRELLMKFVRQTTDVQVAEQFGTQYAKLIPELRIASTDDILKKYKKAKGVLNDRMIEIPARIDEVSKQLVVVDVNALEVEKAAKQVALKKVEDEMSGGNSKLEEINQKRKQVMEEQLNLSGIQNAANEELNQKRREARGVVDACEQKCREIRKELSDVEYDRDQSIRDRDAAERKRLEMVTAWRTEKARKFPEFVPLNAFVEPPALTDDDLKCPTCGQDLPEEIKKKRIEDNENRRAKAKADYDASCTAHEAKYKKDKEVFDSTRAAKLKEITEYGQDAADKVRECKKLIDEKNEKIKSIKASMDEAKMALSDACAACDKIPVHADVSENPEYKKIQENISKLESEIAEMSKDSFGRTELEMKKTVIQDEISEIDRKIAAADNTKVQARINELEAEKKEVGQKIAEQEQMIDLTENFIRAKMDKISEAINDKFKVVSFKLFDNLINGGLQVTCECTVGGVPLSSLNNAHRIIAGLDIINSLSELYEVSCPVFIDNSEAVNERNFPKMDAQMIHLVVTDDAELKVEVA